MGLFKKVTSFVKREAKDLGDAAESVKDRVDDELTKREADLAMTPTEKIESIEQQAAATDARFQEIADKATSQAADTGTGDAPNITQIVLPDGRIKSGADLDGPRAEASAAHSTPQVDPDAVAATGVAEPAPEPAPAPEIGSLEWATAPDPAPEPAAAAAPPAAPEPTTPAASPSAPAPPAEPEPTTPAASPSAPAPPAAPEPTTPAASPSAPAPPAAPEPTTPAVDPEEFGKTPAQIKYEKARAAANELLEELRGELRTDGDL